MKTLRSALAALVTLALLGLAFGFTAQAALANYGVVPVEAKVQSARVTHQPCVYEDSVDCVWDARHMGNGTGKSFYCTKAGKVVYITHKRAHRMLSNFAR